MRSNRPSDHVMRPRKKLPGYHNRRYKGKSTECDHQRTVLEGYRAAKVWLPLALQSDLDLLVDTISLELLWAAAQLLTDVEADETVIVLASPHGLFLDFVTFCVDLKISDGQAEGRIVDSTGMRPCRFTSLRPLVKKIEKELACRDELTFSTATMTQEQADTT